MRQCKGETRSNGYCNFDSTHRVCAKINGRDDFFKATNQESWCGVKDRCPNSSHPNWCICKWAFADWVDKVGCENVEIDCLASDIEHVLKSTTDANRNLTNAHECILKKCSRLRAIQITD